MSMVGEHRAPMRTCVGCRANRAQSELLRLRLEGARVVPAIGRRASGRSAYLCPRRACLDQAIKRRAFTRAFSSQKTMRAVETLDRAGADALWHDLAAQLDRELAVLLRSAQHPHAHPRRPGLERLLFELSSTTAPVRRPPANGQGGSSTHG